MNASTVPVDVKDPELPLHTTYPTLAAGILIDEVSANAVHGNINKRANNAKLPYNIFDLF
jgi:hypothetical protein